MAGNTIWCKKFEYCGNLSKATLINTIRKMFNTYIAIVPTIPNRIVFFQVPENAIIKAQNNMITLTELQPSTMLTT